MLGKRHIVEGARRVVAARMSTFHEFSAQTLTGETKSMSEYKDNVVLVVNTATL